MYDGTDILRHIREAPALEHIHVIVLSGLASPSQRLEIEGLGALYRTKPSLLSELNDLAAEVIAICKRPSSAVASS
jgi:CheY-like chemotaxis protein